MNPLKALPFALLILLAACDGPDAEDSADTPSGPAASAETVDLLPYWEETLEVREEHRLFQGAGAFPPEAEVASRSSRTVTGLDVYRVEVAKADGSRLLETRRTYLTSVRTEKGERKPTAVQGNTYRIVEPLGAFRADRLEGEDLKPISDEELRYIRDTALRRAASLLPTERQAVGATWMPGRNRSALAAIGRESIEMVAKLAGVADGLATVTCRTEAQGGDPAQPAQLKLTETLTMDLSGARFAAYEALREERIPGRERVTGGWRRVVRSATFRPAE
jgi:hypothetical protein